MRRFLPVAQNTYGVDICNYSDNELLKFYDNPKNFYINDCKVNSEVNDFPENVVLTLPHGSFQLKDGAEHELSSKNLRLLKGFSDFGTTSIVNTMNIPEKQIVRAKYSRAIGDLNRNISDNSENGFLRGTDFSGNVLFKNAKLFKAEGIRHHKKFHNEIKKKLIKVERDGGKSFLFDIHDTGVRDLGIKLCDDKITNELFPLITIANCGEKSCDAGMLNVFSKIIQKYLGVECLCRIPYSGGYIIQNHGVSERFKGNLKRNAIQIEIGRFLYVKESTQEIDNEKAEVIGNGLRKAIIDFVLRFN